MGSYICVVSFGGFEDLVCSYGINFIEILKEIGILFVLFCDLDLFIYYDYYLNLLEKVVLVC